MQYLFDLAEFVRDVLLRWPELVTGGFAGLSWIVYEKCRGKPVSMKVFVAILGAGLFFAAFGAWREQYAKSRSSLTMSVHEFRFDLTNNELSAIVQFTNQGAIRRIILGTTFVYHSKEENGQNLLIKSDDPYLGGVYDHSSPRLYVEPGMPIVQTYKYTLEPSMAGLTNVPGEVFGLQVVSLTSDNFMNIATVECVMVEEYVVGEQKGVVMVSPQKRNISLDRPSYIKAENMIRRQPSPTPDKAASPH